MINYISGLVFTVLLLVGAALALAIGWLNPVWAVLFGIAWFVGDAVNAFTRERHRRNGRHTPLAAERTAPP